MTMQTARDHGALMDSVYRGQRHIYDATRKYYLLGRDRLIDQLALPEGGNVLEIACGTGRNLAVISRRWPSAKLFGLDISAEMLKSASGKLHGKAILAQGDATSFDAHGLLGQARFDRVILSFATSMIPNWTGAIAHAANLIEPGGSLKIVDFGDMAGLPRPFRAILNAWLAKFHVTARIDLVPFLAATAAQAGLSMQAEHGFGNYYSLITLTRPRVQ